MERFNKNNNTCKVKIMIESPSAAQFGREIDCRVIGREHMAMKDSKLKSLYPELEMLDVLLVEDEQGNTMEIPEKDVEIVQC